MALKLRCPVASTEAVTVTAPSGGYVAGEMVTLNDCIGVVATATAAAALAAVFIKAPKIVLACAAAATAGYAVGEKVYYDGTQITETASGATLCGTVNVASVVGATEVNINFDGRLGITS